VADTVLYELDGHVATITYNRPEALNALNELKRVAKMPPAPVVVRVNADLRPSRLVRSIFSYVRRSIVTILRIFILYRPVAFFLSMGTLLFLGGVAVGIRFLYLRYWLDVGTGHVQSVILAAVLMIFGFQTGLLAFIADLLSVNRRLLEELLEAKRMARKDRDG